MLCAFVLRGSGRMQKYFVKVHPDPRRVCGDCSRTKNAAMRAAVLTMRLIALPGASQLIGVVVAPQDKAAGWVIQAPAAPNS